MATAAALGVGGRFREGGRWNGRERFGESERVGEREKWVCVKRCSGYVSMLESQGSTERQGKEIN